MSNKYKTTVYCGFHLTIYLYLYSLFFIPEQSTTKQKLDDTKKIEQNSDTPSLDQKETLIQISREDALKESERVQFDTITHTGGDINNASHQFHLSWWKGDFQSILVLEGW